MALARVIGGRWKPPARFRRIPAAPIDRVIATFHGAPPAPDWPTAHHKARLGILALHDGQVDPGIGLSSSDGISNRAHTHHYSIRAYPGRTVSRDAQRVEPSQMTASEGPR